jgi:hypothetical protein
MPDTDDIASVAANKAVTQLLFYFGNGKPCFKYAAGAVMTVEWAKLSQ